jgi:mannan endo-1,4-beta-mannosidase
MSNRGVALRACFPRAFQWTSLAAAVAITSWNGASAQERDGYLPPSVEDRIDAMSGNEVQPRDNFARIIRPASTEPYRELPEPSISGTPPTQAQVGKEYSFTPTIRNLGDTPMSFSISNKPSWASFSISSGRLSGTPTSAGTTTGVVISVSNGRGRAELPPFSIAVSAASQSAGSVRLSASPTSIASGGNTTLTWSSTGESACTASGGWSGNKATSGSLSTGKLSATTAYTLTCKGSSGGSSIAQTTVTVAAVSTGTGDGVARPSYNTGNGFFVWKGQLYDPNGNPFRIRGVNRVHYDSTSAAGIAKSGANAVRWLILFSRSPSENVSEIQTQGIANGTVPIVGNWNGTCNSDTGTLQSIVSTWVSQASAWTTLDRYLIVNIANEWGPSSSTVWRDAYISAIASLRNAGYLGPLLIDSGGCGQNLDDLLNYSTAVFNSDPQKNVIFALHVYGVAASSLANNYYQQLANLSQQNGMVFIIGEFGPGKNIGPSPTDVTPGQIITAAEAAGLGWLAWAWDDNNLADGKSDNTWFSMTYNGPGVYTQPSDLTDFGLDVVLNPTYGISALAKRASVFSQ